MFNLGWYSLIPPTIALIGMIKRYPAALVILVSSVFALGVGILANGFAVQDGLKTFVLGFDAPMTGAEGLSESARSLLNRGGLASMAARNRSW